MGLYIQQPKVIRAYQACDKNIPDWLKNLIVVSSIGRNVITVVGGASWYVDKESYIIVNDDHEAVAVVDKDRFEANYICYMED